MKKLLLATFCCIPLFVFAQRDISAGFDIGLAPHTLPLNNKTYGGAFVKSNSLPLYLAGHVYMTRNEKNQWGLQMAIAYMGYSIDYTKANFKLYQTIHFNLNPRSEAETYTVAFPAIPITFIYNRIMSDRALSWYIGAEAGYENYFGSGTEENKTYVAGLLGGAHIGATCELSERVKLRAQAAIDYHYSLNNVHFQILSFPLTLGLDF